MPPTARAPNEQEQARERERERDCLFSVLGCLLYTSDAADE